MPKKNNQEKSPFKEEEKDKECNMEINKNDLAFAAMDVTIKKDTKKMTNGM